jgi:carbonic anhydrase/acetyltransferase-like protein (isoleucine patch superfamily)
MGARILNGAVIEPGCIVGAAALVTEGKTFPAGSLIVGSPARAMRQVTEAERQLLRASAAHYAQKAERYSAELTPLAQ